MNGYTLMPRCRNFGFLGTSRLIEPRQPVLHQPHAPEGKSMYRILTEEKNVDEVKAKLKGLGLDFTLFHALGSWHGKEENSLAIELDNVPRDSAEHAAMRIQSLNAPHPAATDDTRA